MCKVFVVTELRCLYKIQYYFRGHLYLEDDLAKKVSISAEARAFQVCLKYSSCYTYLCLTTVLNTQRQSRTEVWYSFRSNKRSQSWSCTGLNFKHGRLKFDTKSANRQIWIICNLDFQEFATTHWIIIVVI